MNAAFRVLSRAFVVRQIRFSSLPIHLVTFLSLTAQTLQQHVMKCEEMLAMLNEYVDGTIDPAVCGEFEKHMAGCNPCQVVVDNIRKTITLYKNGRPYELPVKFREQLHEALRAQWRQKRLEKKAQS